MEIIVVSAVFQFREAVAAHGRTPTSAVISRQMFQRLVAEAGPFFRDTRDGQIRLDGIVLEVVDE